MAIKTEGQQQKDGTGQVTGTQPGAPVNTQTASNSGPKTKRPIVPIIAAVLVVVGGIYGARYLAWSKDHVSTDDAEISSDLVQIAPQVSGTVKGVYVLENEPVKAGQLLVELDSATYKVELDQAKANLDAARAQKNGADASVGLTSATTDAQVSQAEAGVSSADAGVLASEADLSRAIAAIASSKAQADSAFANVSSAQANYNSAVAAEARAVQALKAANAQTATASAAVQSAQAQSRSARITADRAHRDALRYQTLFTQGAISASVYDQATSAAEVAVAQLQSVQDAVTQASANLQSAQANSAGAQSQVDAARAAVAQAKSGISAAKGQAEASKDAITQAIAAKTAYQAAIANAKSKIQLAEGQLAQAKTGPRQVHVSEASAGQAGARTETAQAQFENAQINFQRTKIYAPVDGRVSRKTVTVGNLVAPGTPLMSVIPAEQVWVIANFKETQLTDVRIGQPVEVEVDAFPGRVFRGKVDSLSAGTGATFALLPPDNATGNFTKVVQRIPVKITLEPGQPDLDRLTVGMSVTATIQTKSN